jgi:hypothetical protein
VADGLGCHLHAPPASAGPVQHGPHQAQPGTLSGEPADDFDPPAGLAEGPLDEVGVPDPVPVLLGEAQVGDEVLEVVGQAGDRRGVELGPLGLERLDPPASLGLPELDLGEVPGPERLELGLDRLAHPAHRRLRHAGRLAQRLYHRART